MYFRLYNVYIHTYCVCKMQFLVNKKLVMKCRNLVTFKVTKALKEKNNGLKEFKSQII
jgi:hypothetical protein